MIVDQDDNMILNLSNSANQNKPLTLPSKMPLDGDQKPITPATKHKGIEQVVTEMSEMNEEVDRLVLKRESQLGLYMSP